MTAAAPIDRPSPNHDARPDGRTVDMLVLHYTGMRSAEEALERLCDPSARVSAHYLIDEDGAVWRLVAEDRRAWHAGLSAWRGEADVNGRSVGIELVNPGHEFGYRPFPPAQMAALVALCRDILARHPIPAANVVGHSDVAPLRKQDPGELFDWRGLAAAGIGMWPEPGEAAPAGPADARGARAALAGIGYAVGAAGDGGDAETRAAIAAFQRRYRPARIDGAVDAETAALIEAVARLAT